MKTKKRGRKSVVTQAKIDELGLDMSPDYLYYNDKNKMITIRDQPVGITATVSIRQCGNDPIKAFKVADKLRSVIIDQHKKPEKEYKRKVIQRVTVSTPKPNREIKDLIDPVEMKNNSGKSTIWQKIKAIFT